MSALSIHVPVVVVLLLIALPNTVSAGDEDGDLIIDSVGWGLSETVDVECADELGGPAHQFRGERGLLCISRSPPWSAQEVVLWVQTHSLEPGDAFDVGDVVPSSGLVLDAASPEPVYDVFFGASSYLYWIIFVASDVPPDAFDPEVFVVELASAHVDLVAGKSAKDDPTAPGDPLDRAGVDQDLARLLLGIDGYETGVGPIADVHLLAESTAISGDVARAVGRETKSILQFYEHPDGALVGVSIARYRFPTFAAAALGDDEAIGVDDELVIPLAHRRDGLLATSSAETVGVAFRQGRYLYFVEGSPTAGMAPEDAFAVVSELATVFYDSGPGGDTSAFVFPTMADAVWQTSVIVASAVAILLALRILIARRARVTRAAPDGQTIVRVDHTAGVIRLRSRMVVAVQFVSIGVLTVGLTVLRGGVALIVAAVALLVGVGVGFAVRRLDLPRAGRRSFTLPGVGGFALGAIALVTLLAGGLLLARGTRTWLFTPSLEHLELSDRLGINPTRLGQFIVAVGLALLVAGAPLFRAARRKGRATVERLRRADVRAEVLYLRSFVDDALPIPTSFSSRRPFLETFTISAREPFEESLAWQLGGLGPVVAVGDPRRPLASLGAAREHLPWDDWQPRVQELMARAQMIVMVVARSTGLQWEIDQAVRGGYLANVVFVVPPVDDGDIEARWVVCQDAIAASGVVTTAMVCAPCALAITVAPDGSAIAFTARKRDEAGYRAAINVAAARMAGRPARSAE